MKTIPILETVAGEAFSMLWTSNNSLHEGDIVILSPFARVRVLLSSKTEFKFSIQIASTGPSKTRNTFSPGKIIKRERVHITLLRRQENKCMKDGLELKSHIKIYLFIAIPSISMDAHY